MKNKWPFFIIRLLNIFLLVSLILTIVSCNGITMGKDKQRKSVVTTDTPWYDGTIITVDLGLDTKRTLLEMSPKLAGADDKLIVIYADGVYQVEDWGKINCNADYCIRNLSIIDRSTKQTEGLTPSEKAEQTELRNQYRALVIGNLSSQLEGIKIKNPDGTITDVKKKQ